MLMNENINTNEDESHAVASGKEELKSWKRVNFDFYEDKFFDAYNWVNSAPKNDHINTTV